MLPQIYGEYVAPGRVELIFLDLPLNEIHPDALLAARAAHCAGEQDLFWEMHHQLFANRAALKRDDLELYADELNVDLDAFNECLDSRRHTAAIRNDAMLLNRVGVRSTPTYLLGERIPETERVRVVKVLKGSQSVEELSAAIDTLLSK